ncbi:sulfate transporter isoform X2 [Patella vulgata]|uniref:sulfate transporter isoform X2 n=1 Tax=Patella vulgata TaxID=6465 RepID=UPI00217FF792|nr:sulfate transporter isoform X2 [Patella vulgata]
MDIIPEDCDCASASVRHVCQVAVDMGNKDQQNGKVGSDEKSEKFRRSSCPPTMASENLITVRRQPFTQTSFDELHLNTDQTSVSRLSKLKDNIYCSKKRSWKILTSYVPFIKTIRYYKLREYLMVDFLAGLTVGILHIPQALGFGQLTSVKIENGLYTSLWPVLIYMMFGTSPHVSMGTSAVICILTAAVVDRQGEMFQALHPEVLNQTFNGTDTLIPVDEVAEYLDYKESIAMSVTLFCGLMMIAMGFLKLGFITAYLSESFFAAFTSGAAVHIFTSQVTPMLGLNVPRHSGIFKIVKNYKGIFEHITEVNFTALICAVITMVVILIVKDCINERFKHKIVIPIPIELIVVIVGTLAAYFGEFNKNFGVDIVGSIPNTIPAPVLPPVDEAPNFLVDCFILAILIFANTIAMAKICAKKHNYEVDDSQEMIAYGMCNFLSCFFKCFPSSVAPPRSMVSSAMNTKTMLNGLVTSVLILLIILFISPLFAALPKAILAAIIAVALKGLFVQISIGYKYWKVSKYDFVIWLSTFLAVVFLDIDVGLGIGVGVSLISVVFQTQFASGYRVGRSKDGVFVEHKKYNDSQETLGVKVFRYNSSLYFANAEIFRSQVYGKTVNPRKLLKLLKKKEKKVAKMQKDGGYNNEFRRDSVITRELNNDIATSPGGDPVKSPAYDSIQNRLNNAEIGMSTFSSMDNPGFSIPEEMSSNSYTLKQNGVNNNTQSRMGRRHSSMDSTFLDDEEDPDDGGEVVTDAKLRSLRKTHHVIIDCAAINYLDVSGASVLSHMFVEYGHVNITMFLAGCSATMRDAMKHAGVYEKIGLENVFVELSDAVAVAKTHKIIPLPSSGLGDFSDDEAAEDSYVTNL